LILPRLKNVAAKEKFLLTRFDFDDLKKGALVGARLSVRRLHQNGNEWPISCLFSEIAVALRDKGGI
jgi:hypothetical protein